MHLLAEPPGTDSSVIMSNGDSAEGTEECSNLNIKDVCPATLKVTSLQKHLEIKLKFNVRQTYREEVYLYPTHTLCSLVEMNY